MPKMIVVYYFYCLFEGLFCLAHVGNTVCQILHLNTLI